MYYFKFHIRDYAASTAYLTNEEDLAYRRLLDMYYSTEAPIPLEVTLVAKRIRCEPSAVRDVLTEKFTRTDDGFRHERCDAEISEYQQSAERNRTNGMGGGRPKKPSGFPVGSQSVPSGNPVATQPEPTGNPNQEPSTINQEPVVETPATDARSCPPDWEPSRELVNLACVTLKDLAFNKELAMFKAYRWQRPVRDWNEAFRRWIAQADKTKSYAKQEWH